MPSAPALVWLNGAFGAGKSSVAAELQTRGDGVVVFDPEQVGFLLRGIVPVPTGDFQDLPPWRELVVATAVSLHRHSRSTIVAPMTVLRRTYLHEILSGLHAHGVDVLQVLLDAPDAELRRRITRDTTLPTRDGIAERSTQWRLAKLDDYVTARHWLRDEADVVVDTGRVSVSQVATAVLDAMLEPSRFGQAGRGPGPAGRDG
jgi:hypothetical protein